MENQTKIYIPQINENQCAYVLDSETIRVLDSNNLNENVNYTDYFINSHYISKSGSILLTESVDCIRQDIITSDFYYRNDLSDILICFLIILFICFYFPTRIMARFFKRLR